MNTPTWTISKLTENIKMLRSRTKHNLVGKEEYRQYILLPYLASMGYEPSNMNEVVLYSKLGQLDIHIHEDFYMTISMDSINIPQNTSGKAKIHLGIDLLTQEFNFYLLALGKWELIYHFDMLGDIESAKVQENYVGMMRYMVKESILEEYNAKEERVFTEGALDKLLQSKDYNNRFLHYVLEKEIKNPSHELLLLIVSRFKEYFTTVDSENIFTLIEPLKENGIIGIVDSVLNKTTKDKPLSLVESETVTNEQESTENNNDNLVLFENDEETDVKEYQEETDNQESAISSLLTELSEVGTDDTEEIYTFTDDNEETIGLDVEQVISEQQNETEEETLEEIEEVEEDFTTDYQEDIEEQSNENEEDYTDNDTDNEVIAIYDFEKETITDEESIVGIDISTMFDTTPNEPELVENVEPIDVTSLFEPTSTAPTEPVGIDVSGLFGSQEEENSETEQNKTNIIEPVKVKAANNGIKPPVFDPIKVEKVKKVDVATPKHDAVKVERNKVQPNTTPKFDIPSVKVEKAKKSDVELKQRTDGSYEMEMDNIVTTKQVNDNLEFREKNKDMPIDTTEENEDKELLFNDRPMPKKKPLRKLNSATPVGVKDRMAEMRERMKEK